jgi:hypothetical protein
LIYEVSGIVRTAMDLNVTLRGYDRWLHRTSTHGGTSLLCRTNCVALNARPCSLIITLTYNAEVVRGPNQSRGKRWHGLIWHVYVFHSFAVSCWRAPHPSVLGRQHLYLSATSGTVEAVIVDNGTTL